jgi:uridine phosphorylase
LPAQQPNAEDYQPIHLRPTTQLAERVLLPGDPGRALMLAQLLLEKPLMFNHHRGLWGYTGTAADGQPLTIQSTGMGGPSAAIVLDELIGLGARRAIRVGTCGALTESLALGDLVLAREAIAADGTSTALGAGPVTRADQALSDALAGQLSREPLGEVLAGQPSRNAGRRHLAGRIASTDLFYERDNDRGAEWVAGGAIAVEMEAATLFTLGAQAGVAVGCLLAVSDTFAPDGRRLRIDDRSLTAAGEAMGQLAIGALSA